MTKKPITLLILLFACCASTFAADSAGLDLAGKRERLEQLETRAKQLRREANAVHAREAGECRQGILVNHCLGEARDRRLTQIQAARTIEAEAATLATDIRRQELAERRRDKARRRGEEAPAATVTVDGHAPATR